MSAKSDEQRQSLAKERATSLLGSEPQSLVNPITVLASPAWRGVESDVWLATSDSSSAFLKHYHDDTEFYVDASAANEAATAAGKIGVGPKALQTWSDDKMIAFEELVSPWVAGGLHHILDSKIRENIIGQKKAFQNGVQLSKTTTIFDEITGLYAITQKEEIVTHNDIVPFMDFAKAAETKIRALGWDTKPCHRDGNTANLMIKDDKSVLLIDYDLAANCDPFEDMGAYLIEAYESDVDARSGFEEWHGNFDEGLFQRAMIYGLLDDLRWGLIGSILGVQSDRSSLEFTKYAAWRFIRLQAQAKSSDANDRIRLAA